TRRQVVCEARPISPPPRRRRDQLARPKGSLFELRYRFSSFCSPLVNFPEECSAQRPAFWYCCRDLIAILRIGLAGVRDRSFDDVFAADLREACRDVRDQSLLLLVAHQPVEVSGLNEVVVVAMMHRRVISGEPGDFDWRR